MEKITLKQIARTYKNNGQHAEQTVRFTLTGRLEKADNKSHDAATDCLTYQIKTSKATICKGDNIAEYVATEKATQFIYVSKDFQTAYIMSATEYIDFATQFTYLSRESKKNGGTVKRRLYGESQKMRDWLERA